MADTKYPTIRYQTLDRCFRNKYKRYYIDDLIDACSEAIYDYCGKEIGCSRRTILSDIDFMESDAGWRVPLERYKDGRKVYYRYRDTSFTINETLLSETEYNKLNEAVTKGLYFDVKMKDSGIEGGWSIPVHWSSNRLKFLADIVRGGSPRPIEEYIADEGYKWIKIGDTIKGYKYIESTKEKIKPSGLNATREVHVNDLILSNSMSFGQPYILKIDGCIHDGWLAFTNYKGLDKEYLYYVLQAGVCSCQFEHYVAGGVVQNLNIEKVATTRIPLPPLAEQQSIATYLDKKTAQIDSSIDSLEVQRDDLNALKQSIVSEAVTGKIDLRDWKLKK